MKRYLDTVILGLGIFFLGFGTYLVIERHTPAHVYASVIEPNIKEQPTRLTISSLDINLSIYPALIHDKKWDITKDGVSYLSTSPLPGDHGNSVLYGHNWPTLLGSLKHIQPGDIIEIQNNHGETFSYIVYFVSVVTPDETHIYQNTDDYRLTLYTCTGLLDSKRLVVTAILK